MRGPYAKYRDHRTLATTITSEMINAIYDQTIRPHLPRKLGVYNGVVTRAPRLFDRTDVQPDFKAALMNGIRELTKSGDTVYDIGGGYGVASVIAAKQTPPGHVTCFEPTQDHTAIIREAVRLNEVAEHVTIRKVLVEAPVKVWGEFDETISATDLDPCDVLIMDCEGAEQAILENLSFKPRAIIAELHPRQGVDVAHTHGLLEGQGYSTRWEKNPTGGKNPVLIGTRVR